MNLERLKLESILSAIVILLVAIGVGCSKPENKKPDGVAENDPANASVKLTDERAGSLLKYREAIAPFFDRMKIIEGDWLETFKEGGQTFEEYVSQDPTLPTKDRKKIYIQPLGEFTKTQKEILKLTAEFMEAFYDLPVVLNELKPLRNIPDEFKRKNPFEGQSQIKTGYFIEHVLPKMLPDDAAALICFTNFDLFPDESFNYVFGQASLSQRVGVWSLWRFGKPDRSKKDFEMFLGRTLKVGMHETGHMFSMQHCTKYECLMSGSNHLMESDRRPLDVCPECVLKIAWGMDYDLRERYRKLAKFCEARGWKDSAETFLKKAAAVDKVKE